MKKILAIFTFLTLLFFSTLASNAKDNYLHTITLEKSGDKFTVLLNADQVTKVQRKTVADNEIVLELFGIKASDTVNALYKGTNDIGNLIIENSGGNSLKIYITAENIKNSSILFRPNGGDLVIAPETMALDKIIWISFVLCLFLFIIVKSKKKVEEDDKIAIKKDIKEREIALYKQYRKNFEEDMGINPKNVKMRTLLKKIDRKIDERLSNITLK